MTVHSLVMHPVWVGGTSGYRYDVYRDGVLVVEKSRNPLCDAARFLSDSGHTGTVELSRVDNPVVAMRGSIERFSSLMVSEGDRHSPVFRKWKPFPSGDASASENGG